MIKRLEGLIGVGLDKRGIMVLPLPQRLAIITWSATRGGL